MSLTHYNHDFDTMINMSLTQMMQAGHTSWEQCKHHATSGITDFSIREEADHFHEQLRKHLERVEAEEKETRRPFIGVFEYKPLFV
jgi:hypothetical protein